jgi:hypothetical protein
VQIFTVRLVLEAAQPPARTVKLFDSLNDPLRSHAFTVTLCGPSEIFRNVLTNGS